MKVVMPCQCPPYHVQRAVVKRPPVFRRGRFSSMADAGLGFTIDWGGIVGNAVKAYGAVQQTRSAIVLARAQQEAAFRAQQAELQLMQRRQAMTVAQPADGGVQRVLPAAPRGITQVPSWAIPAAIGVGVLFLMRK